MGIATSVAKIGEIVAIWLNPERREKVVLREAIESAEQLLMILRKQGIYEHMQDDKRRELETHYQKRFDAWKDGQ